MSAPVAPAAPRRTPARGRAAEGDLAPSVGRAFWIAIVAVSLVGALTAALVLAQRRATEWVYHSRDVLRLARQAQALATDREASIRGFLVTRADTLLTIERLARPALPAKLDTLLALTADNPRQQARAHAIAGAVRDWDARFALPMLGAPPARGDTLPALLDKPLFDRVRARFAEFVEVEDALYDERRRRATRAQWLVLATIVGGLATVGLMLHRLRAGLLAQASSLDEKQHQLEEQAVELEAQTAEMEATNQELHDTNERLVLAVGEATRVNQELEAFSYTMAHDLRAPLRALDGYGYMLQEDYAERLDARGREHLTKLRAASGRMARLIDDLLELARVGRGELRRERVDLGDLARTALEDLRRAEPARRVEATIAEGLVAEGDALLLSLVMQNLVGNAWKFSAGRDVAHLEVGIARDGAQRAYFVRDDGVGFDPAYAESAFGSFQRLHGAAFEGTGIGLAIVHRIVSRHGGRVWAESSPGQGATFHFTIPQSGFTVR